VVLNSTLRQCSGSEAADREDKEDKEGEEDSLRWIERDSVRERDTHIHTEA
jgi:hypothetical protein